MESLPFPTGGCSSTLSRRNSLIAAILLLISFLSTDCFASGTDKIDLRGTVRERNGEAMAGVIVTVKDSRNINIAYARSTKAGRFSLSYPATLTDGTIHFSCMGYRELVIPLSRFRNNADYVLEEAPFELKEVTVKLPPIRVKGDTLTYDVGQFRYASDRTIEDVIRKLPGIDVTDNGRIYYNGEPINKFYIEGLDLLSGRYALATRNISPDDVASVNIYENHQPKKVLKDIEYSDKAALNLKLKNKKLIRPSGYVRGGAGIDADGDVPWTGEVFGLQVAPDIQFLVSAKGNNTGKSYRQETASLTGSEASQGTTAAGIYPGTPFGSAGIPTSRYYDNNSTSASVNAISRLRKNTTLNVVADYADDSFEYLNDRSVIYAVDDGDNIVISESATSMPHLREAKLKTNIEHNADSRYLSDKLSFTGHFNSNRYLIETPGAINQRVSTRDFSLQNLFDGTFRLSDHVIELKSETRFGTTPWNRLAAVADGRALVSQNVRGHNFANREECGYAWIINSRSHIGLKASFSFDYGLFQSIDELPAENRNNDISGYKIATTLEPSYQYKAPMGLLINVSAPLKLLNMKYHNAIDERYYPTDRLDVDFRTALNYNTPFNMKTALTVGRNSRTGGISDYVTDPVHTTFRQSSVLGSGRLTRRDNLYAGCDLSYRNAIEGFFSSASLMFTQTKSNRLGGLDVSEDDITSSYRSLDNKSNNFSVNLSASKKIFGWNTSFSLNASYLLSNRDMIRQNSIVGMDMSDYTVGMGIDSNPLKNYLIMALNVKYSYSEQRVDMFGLKNGTSQATVNLSLITRPISSLEIGAKGYFNRSDVADNRSKSSLFLDSHVRYSVKSFEVELSARNLTNTRSYRYSYIKDSDIYNYSFRLRPLELLLSLKYSF